MRSQGILLVTVMSIGLLGACAKSSDADRTLIASANAAAPTAQQASADASAASETADRMFPRTLRN